MVWSRENCVQIYKSEFKVYKWDFSAEIFLYIDHSRTVHNVQSSSTLFMAISLFSFVVIIFSGPALFFGSDLDQLFFSQEANSIQLIPAPHLCWTGTLYPAHNSFLISSMPMKYRALYCCSLPAEQKMLDKNIHLHICLQISMQP